MFSSFSIDRPLTRPTSKCRISLACLATPLAAGACAADGRAFRSSVPAGDRLCAGVLKPLHLSGSAREGEAATCSAGEATTSTQSNTQSSTAGAELRPQFRFLAAAAMIPHPAKAHRGGEDAYFIADSGLALGVADGVGSWEERGINAGLYSRMLMEQAALKERTTTPGAEAAQQILEAAHANTDAQGSSTACVAVLEGNCMHVANVGDSGVMVLRAGNYVFRSPPHQHDFNYPFQLARADTMSDSPSSSQRFTVELERGDLVVLATDGLHDNVFPAETARLVTAVQRRGQTPAKAADALSASASTRANDREYMSPFAAGLQRLGINDPGGKLDDITVIVAYVADASKL